MSLQNSTESQSSVNPSSQAHPSVFTELSLPPLPRSTSKIQVKNSKVNIFAIRICNEMNLGHPVLLAARGTDLQKMVSVIEFCKERAKKRETIADSIWNRTIQFPHRQMIQFNKLASIKSEGKVGNVEPVMLTFLQNVDDKAIQGTATSGGFPSNSIGGWEYTTLVNDGWVYQRA